MTLIYYFIPWISCFISSFRADVPISENFEDSRRKGVLFTEYKAVPNSFTLSTGETYVIKKIWTEKFWHYTNECKTEFAVDHKKDWCYLNIQFADNKCFPDSMAYGLLWFNIDSLPPKRYFAYKPLGDRWCQENPYILNKPHRMQLLYYKDDIYIDPAKNYKVVCTFEIIPVNN